MYDEQGYPNRWGGFHRTTDADAYWVFFRFILRNPIHARFALRMARARWVHRGCDTTDFHHAIGCLLDPFVQRVEADLRWHRTWTTPSANAPEDSR